MRRTTRMISKLGKKGYNYGPKKNKFRSKKFNKSSGGDKKKCYNCGDYEHMSYYCPHPDKRNKNKSKINDTSDDEDKHKKKGQDKKKKKLFSKKVGGRKAYIIGEWVSDESSSGDSSDDEDDDDDFDTELSLLMRRTTKMISKLGKKGYNYDPKNKFRSKKFNKFSGGDNKKCNNCGEYGNISYYCPHPDKRNKNKSKKIDANENEDKHKKKG